jgi:serine/threonine protein kinase
LLLKDHDRTAAHAYIYDTQVDKDFNVKIADFGLARLKAHVMTGNLGTCQYMAPGNSHTPTLHLCTAAVHCVCRVLNLSPVWW